MEMTIKEDLEQLFTGFRWNIVGMIDNEGNVYPLPPIPQVISGVFQELTKHKVNALMREKCRCDIAEGGPREYPELTLYGGDLRTSKIAIDIKTARRAGPNRISGFTLGSYRGYSLYPDRKMA